MKSFNWLFISSLFFSMHIANAQVESEPEYHFLGTHLPAPPVEGTDAYRADFTKLHEYQDHRTPEQCATAEAESSFSVENGFGPATGVLTEAEVKVAKIYTLPILMRVGVAVYYFKHKFKRQRPYHEDTTLQPCIRKPNDLSYPSGHATTGYALALVLSKRFPEKKELIMKQGLQIGENRLIGGVHHPSDVEAGRELARQLVKFF